MTQKAQINPGLSSQLDEKPGSPHYYNRGDLQIGRDMHCRSYPGVFMVEVLACYVTNYGDGTSSFEKSTPGLAIDNAIAAKLFSLNGAPNGLIATVVI